MKIKEYESYMIISGFNNKIHAIETAVSGAVSVLLTGVLIDLIKSSEQDEMIILDYIVYVFLFAFICFMVGVFVFYLNELSKKLIINEQGIKVRSILRRGFIEWSDIEDYGLLFYTNNFRYSEFNIFQLYFSKDKLKGKAWNKKKIKFKTLKAYISEDDYNLVTCRIIPYCRKYSEIKPFIAYIRNDITKY